MKYVYPAIFTKEEGGAYSVRFPDLPGCFTSGESLYDAMEMASDAMCLMLYDMEQRSEEAPAPGTDADAAAQAAAGEFVTMIACDTIEYRKFYDNRAVKKTLSIPSWLNDMAERQDINFSAVLQGALKEALHLN